jgi:geranylgeranyl diphosphate synthase type II
MITEAQIEACLKEMFETIEFTAEPAGLYDPLRYMISIGGKRVRPRLCLLAYSLFKDEFTEEILQPASALEVFHSFTLIHDDIMDKADVRRGLPTVYRKWDENTAILSGDVMSIDSYKRIAKAPSKVLHQVLELYSETAAQVCEGQQYDMDFENMKEVDMEEYLKMVGLKTAVLIACSAKMGALIGGASEKVADDLYEFGYDLGLAFQITDDYLDTFGDAKVFGKAIGGDILNNKKTWLMIKAINKASEEDKAALFAAMDLPIETQEEKDHKIAVVKDIYLKLGIDEDAKYEIIKLHNNAMRFAEETGLGKIKVEMLHRYASKLLGRTK